jgi:hypothetical protein
MFLKTHESAQFLLVTEGFQCPHSSTKYWGKLEYLFRIQQLTDFTSKSNIPKVSDVF